MYRKLLRSRLLWYTFLAIFAFNIVGYVSTAFTLSECEVLTDLWLRRDASERGAASRSPWISAVKYKYDSEYEMRSGHITGEGTKHYLCLFGKAIPLSNATLGDQIYAEEKKLNLPPLLREQTPAEHAAAELEKLNRFQHEYRDYETKALEGVTDPDRRAEVLDFVRPLRENVDAQRIRWKAAQDAAEAAEKK